MSIISEIDQAIDAWERGDDAYNTNPTADENDPCGDCGHFHSGDGCPDPFGPCGDYRCCIN